MPPVRISHSSAGRRILVVQYSCSLLDKSKKVNSQGRSGLKDRAHDSPIAKAISAERLKAAAFTLRACNSAS